jgi:hypothetical protein
MIWLVLGVELQAIYRGRVVVRAMIGLRWYFRAFSN